MPTLPIISFIGWSGSGKTSLLTRLVPQLRARGLSVAAVKHTGHVHPLHRPGSDTEALELAGAAPVVFATPSGVEVIYPQPAEGVLASLPVDLVLVEGWKDGPYPKLEVWRKEVGPSLFAAGTPVEAIVTDDEPPAGVRRFTTAELHGLAQFVTELAGVT